MKTKLNLIMLLLIILSIFSTDEIIAQCTNCDESFSSIQNISSALGHKSKASGYTSLASGYNVIASGDYATSLGSQNYSSGDKSLTIGNYLIGSAESSMVLGGGYSTRSKLSNNISNSLMIGFRSIYPTLFIGPSPYFEGTGRVGIGNVTQPQAKLHIRADTREDASLFLEQEEFNKADVFIGNLAHGIQSSSAQGLIFRTEKNYVFNDGNVGIGTAVPSFNLEVRGKTFTEEFILFNRELYQENIDGWLLTSDAKGRGVWTNPAVMNDHDWEQKGSDVYKPDGYVGIGTSNPTAQLDLADIYPAGGMNLKIGNDVYLSDIDLAHTLGIYSQTSAEMGAVKLGSKGPLLFGLNKNLGIGTRQPSTSLEVSNKLWSGQTVGMCITNPETYSWFIGMHADSKSVNDLMIGNREKLGSDQGSFIIFKPDGSLGLGTDETYGHKLAVNGSIITEEVTVKVQSSWPDFVFSDNYELLPLDKLEQFIKANGHLPQIPAADQVMTDGLDLGKMESLLLQKIEELTLYVLHQQSELDDLKKLLENGVKGRIDN